MILLIDIGNTRIKWARYDAGALGPQLAEVHARWDEETFAEKVLRSGPRARRVLISNVSGARMSDLSRLAIIREWGIEPQFVASTATACGIRNGYSDPPKLGVDRWLAVIGARSLEPGALCAVSVGTAMTIDGLDRAGQHRGGVIVPGPDLMVSALLHNTSDIARRAEQGSTRAALFADNTLGAIRQGADHALAALIERAVNTLQADLGESPTLFITGGASTRIEPALRIAYRSVPDLVLRGLAVFATESDR